MYFNRITADVRNLRSRFWDPYTAHQYVWNFFEPDAQRSRDFLFRFDHLDRTLRYMVISPEPCRELASPWFTESKPYQPKLEAGDRLAFSMRVNPIVCLNNKKHEVVMNLKHRLRSEGREIPDHGTLAHMAAQEWLNRRAEPNGFRYDTDALRVDAHQNHSFVKSRDRKKHRSASDDERRRQRVSVSGLDLAGTLEVTEPEAFKRVLFNGLGSAKGFGFGLMMVRRLA